MDVQFLLSSVRASSGFLFVEETHLIVKMSQVVSELAGAVAEMAGEEAPVDSWQTTQYFQSTRAARSDVLQQCPESLPNRLEGTMQGRWQPTQCKCR
jgi:hypothetical protein